MIIYNKTVWENDKTPLNSENLQKLEDGVEYLFDLNRDIPDAELKREQAETKREQQEGLRQSKDIDRTKTVSEHISKMNSAKSSMETVVNNKIKEVDTKVTEKITQADNKIVDVERRFLSMSSQQQQDAEVIDARLSVDGVTYISLKERLDSMETSPAILFETVEG